MWRGGNIIMSLDFLIKGGSPYPTPGENLSDPPFFQFQIFCATVTHKFKYITCHKLIYDIFEQSHWFRVTS